MKNSNPYESKLKRLLQKEGFADLSQFHQQGFYDEVPLYSRYSDIAFLLELGTERANAVLLQFGIDFLEAIVAYEEHSKPYFAAVTVWKSAEDEPIVPNLFVWFDSALALPGKPITQPPGTKSSPHGKLGRLVERLKLQPPRTKFARGIKRLVAEVHLQPPLDILEDLSTAPKTSRVFIGNSVAPYPSFVVLDTFRKTASHVKP
jgi:Immunity protein 15